MTKTEHTPTSLQREERDLLIRWSSGAEHRIALKLLRDSCPCATCREKHGKPAEASVQPTNALPILGLAEARPLEIESMRPVGQYAYNIAFSDGHSSGIYTFEQLFEIGEQARGQ